MHPAIVVARHILFPSICVSCREDVPFQAADPLCGPCFALIRPAPFVPTAAPLTAIRAAHVFQGPARDLVLRLKYGGKTYLAGYMGARLARSVEAFRPDVDLVVPVPLPPIRRILRGFNPSERLARGISREWRLPVFTDGLRRRTGYPSQTSLGRRARILNARRSFATGSGVAAIRGRNVLLIDDVCTTGATVAACAQLLLSAGAVSVRAAVFAWEPPVKKQESDSVSVAS